MDTKVPFCWQSEGGKCIARILNRMNRPGSSGVFLQCLRHGERPGESVAVGLGIGTRDSELVFQRVPWPNGRTESLGTRVSTGHQKCSREFVVEGAFPREQGPEDARENRHSHQNEVNGIPDPLEPARKN